MSAGFQAGVAGDDQRKEIRPAEATCGICFYLVLFGQVILSIVVLATANATMPLADGSCPAGNTYRYGFYCIDDEVGKEQVACSAKEWESRVNSMTGGRRLVDQGMSSMNLTMEEHLRRLASDTGPASPKGLMMRQLAARRLEGVKVPSDLWQFLEEFVEMPIVIFGCTFLAATAWLFAMTKCTGGVVWGTLVFDIVVMVAGVIWCLVEFEEFNFMLAVLAVGFSIALVLARKQIQNAIVVMHKAMEGLSANKRLFPISFGITLLWIGYFALWIASLIGLDMTKTVGPHPDDESGSECHIVNSYPGELRWLWIVVYYWSTYFFNNAKLIVITAQLGEWFFKGDNADTSIWSRATVWAFHPFKSGGANAICAAIMGATQALMAYVNSKCKMVAAMFNPIEWIPLCLAFALKTIIHTYTKFGLVAASYSGKPFCEAASCTFQLLKQKLGEAIICDYIGKRVMSWCTYMLSLGVAMAALVWGNSLQNYDEANKIFSEIGFLIPTMLFLAYVVSFPFASIILIVLLEAMLPNDMDGTARAILNSLFAAIFMGSITNFLLRTMSHIVVSAMDVIYFCFAVEDDLGQKQERFEDLYTAIKLTIVPGTVNNQGAVMGVPPGQANTMQVACPEGCAAGTTVQVSTPDGRQLQVQVPPGVTPGQIFTVAIPPQEPIVANVVGVPQTPAEGSSVGNPETNQTNEAANA